MKNSFHACLYVIVSILLSTISVEATEPFELPKEYSVEMISTDAGKEVKGMLYVTGNFMCLESTVMGSKAITIIRQDKGVLWTLMPELKMYIEVPLQPGATPAPLPPTNTVWQKVGEEILDGETVEKWTGTFEVQKQPLVMTYWISKSTKVPVQTQFKRDLNKWKNLKAGPQDSKLFELPAGYKKMGDQEKK